MVTDEDNTLGDSIEALVNILAKNAPPPPTSSNPYFFPVFNVRAAHKGCEPSGTGFWDFLAFNVPQNAPKRLEIHLRRKTGAQRRKI